MSINWHYFKKGVPMISSAKGRQKELSMYAKAATSDDMK